MWASRAINCDNVVIAQIMPLAVLLILVRFMYRDILCDRRKVHERGKLSSG